MDFKPPTFKGGEDPVACMRWLRKMEQFFESGNFAERHKVTFTVRVFEGEALHWWDSAYRSMAAPNRAALTWENFDNRLCVRFCATSAVQRTKREFLDLQKGNMSIGNFNSTFLEKLLFAKRLCLDELTLLAQNLVLRFGERLPWKPQWKKLDSLRGIWRPRVLLG